MTFGTALVLVIDWTPGSESVGADGIRPAIGTKMRSGSNNTLYGSAYKRALSSSVRKRGALTNHRILVAVSFPPFAPLMNGLPVEGISNE